MVAGVARLAREALRASRSSALVGRQAAGQQTRGFASGGHGHDVEYAGLVLHPASKYHVWGGKAFASVMWFWIFYRFYNDFDHFVYGPAAHFEHELHEEAHGKGHH